MLKNYSDAALYLENTSKTFGSSKALDNVTLKIMPGEIHGLLGQNGCGKSTVIKILAGFHTPDDGAKLWINGNPVRLPLESGEFNKYGMSFVHQDLGLISDLTVLENFNIGKLAVSGSAYINWNKETTKLKKILKKYKVSISPSDVVASLSQVEKAMLAIVRAVESIREKFLDGEKKSGLLVLDEPTVFLPKAEVDILFHLVRIVAAEGISVLFVSHDLDEVMELTDVVTVLRDGQNVGDLVTSKTSKEAVIELILGKKLEVYKMQDGGNVTNASAAVHVGNVSGELVNNVEFDVRQGEVLGLTGLVGSGFEEMPYLLFGVSDRLAQRKGFIKIDGKRLELKNLTPKQALKNHIALIPADRPDQGSIFDLSIEENMMMLTMKEYNSLKLDKKKMFERCEKLLNQYEVNTNDPKLHFGNLSGGNQQKVLLAKWLQTHPELLILHEPTQGVDIGARQQVYRHIAKATKAGADVICSSSDYEQLEQICDRVLIFVHGRIEKELVGSQVTKANITQYCYDSESNIFPIERKNSNEKGPYKEMQVTAI